MVQWATAQTHLDGTPALVLQEVHRGRDTSLGREAQEEIQLCWVHFFLDGQDLEVGSAASQPPNAHGPGMRGGRL